MKKSAFLLLSIFTNSALADSAVNHVQTHKNAVRISHQTTIKKQTLKNQFRKWFGIVYRDQPDRVDELVSFWQGYVKTEGRTWSGKVIFSDFLLDDVSDCSHYFAVDWNDSESFLNCLDAVGERFDFKFHWTKQNRNKDKIATLIPLAAKQLNQHNVLLYSLYTGSDFYYFVVIPKKDKHDFEQASKQWGVEYTLEINAD